MLLFVLRLIYKTPILCRPKVPHFCPNPLSRRSQKVFAPEKPKQNLKPYDQRTVSFTKSQAYQLLRFYSQVNYKGVCGPETFPGLWSFCQSFGQFLKTSTLLHTKVPNFCPHPK